MNPKQFNYNKKLKSLARKLRKDGTPGEVKLWSEILRARRFYGYQFKVEEDKVRDNFLTESGYKVIRVTEREVIRNINNVIRTLESILPEDESGVDLVIQSPSTRGEVGIDKIS